MLSNGDFLSRIIFELKTLNPRGGLLRGGQPGWSVHCECWSGRPRAPCVDTPRSGRPCLDYCVVHSTTRSVHVVNLGRHCGHSTRDG